MIRAIQLSALLLVCVGCAAQVSVEPPVGDPDDLPPGAKPPPGGAAPAPDESLLPPPGGAPAPPREREAGCDGLPAEGACQGSSAVWCENGMRRSVDCAAVGRVCEYIDEATGFYCGGFRAGAEPPPEEAPEEEADPLPAPPEGEAEEEAPAPGAPPPQPNENPEGAPPPEGEPEAAPAPPEDEEEEEAPPPPEPEPQPEAEPEGAPAPPLPEPPEGEEGAPPPPGGAPDPDEIPAEGTPCGDLSYHGLCSGRTVVYCFEQRVVHHLCAQGETCGWYDDEWGNWCVDE